MGERWEKLLDHWIGAGLIDADTAVRIRAFEAEKEKTLGLRWPVLVALIFGGLLLGAGVLLFVAAHWDELSPGARFTLVLLMVGGFHLAGALVAERFANLAMVLHGLGTLALGAGIFLAGQIFNLAEHWPGGLMLWALGAWIGWGLRRDDWLQPALAAVLTPAWLAGEWIAAIEHRYQGNLPLAQSLFLLAIVYLTAQTREHDTYLRRALATIGALALIPCTPYLIFSLNTAHSYYGNLQGPPLSYAIVAYVVGFALPVGVGFALRRRDGWMYLVAAFWVVIVGLFDPDKKYQSLGLFFWCMVGGAGMTLWGLHDERRDRTVLGTLGTLVSVMALLFWAQEYKGIWIYPVCAVMSVGAVAWGVRAARKEGINAGILMFALTVGFFYFSTVMDKLSRSASMIGLGLLFLLGGWALEKTRRRLVAGVDRGGK